MLARALTLTLLLPGAARALDILPNLSEGDRREVISTIGSSTSEKILSNPFPLGGFAGVEIGYSIEFVNVRELRRIGGDAAGGESPGGDSSAGDQAPWKYTRLTIGKGIYDDVDVFFSLMAPAGDQRASDYGGTIRWSFYQAEFLPINASLSVAANQLNYADAFSNQNVGADLVAGVNVDNFAMYFGAGLLQSTGTFTACGSTADGDACLALLSDPAANGATRTITQRQRQAHSVIGFSLHLSRAFVAAQVDRLGDAVYSTKLGLRF